MSTVLGISAYYHDSAAALIIDGKIIAAMQEERFSRRKNDPGLPRRAAQACLAQGGITADELDRVVFYENPFGRLERGSQDQVETMLAALGPQATRVVQAMATIEQLLGAPDAPPATLRSHRPGDIGWVVQSHGALYASEYGFDASFESLVAEIAAKFLASFDASRERCWIADIDGTDSIVVRHQSNSISQAAIVCAAAGLRSFEIVEDFEWANKQPDINGIVIAQFFSDVSDSIFPCSDFHRVFQIENGIEFPVHS